MPDLLLELYSEDMPARMQTQATIDLERLIANKLMESSITWKEMRVLATPRRLTLIVRGLPSRQPDQREERKGPRVDAPDRAIRGFMRSVGLKSKKDMGIQEDRKGAYYVVVKEDKGRPVSNLLAELIPEIIRSFPWPRSMRWGNGGLRWIRPLRSILCILNGKIIPFKVGDIASGNRTRGHATMSPDFISVHSIEDYEKRLEESYVCLDMEERIVRIRKDVNEMAGNKKVSVPIKASEALIAELAGQVEWPLVFMGKVDLEFMNLPDEILTSVMGNHQQYIWFIYPDGSRVAHIFAFVADLERRKLSKTAVSNIISGNENVLRTRLNDAQFYWERDCDAGIVNLRNYIGAMEIHPFLGTMHDKTKRMIIFALAMDNLIVADTSILMTSFHTAINLSKADLAADTVREFPELQGIVGRHLASGISLDREIAREVADAIGQHYAPLGPSDAIPSSPLGKRVALIDKLDNLVGFFAVGEKPTGAGDPHALRRAALGIIRIVLEGEIHLPLRQVIREHEERIRGDIESRVLQKEEEMIHGANVKGTFEPKFSMIERQIPLTAEEVKEMEEMGDEDLEVPFRIDVTAGNGKSVKETDNRKISSSARAKIAAKRKRGEIPPFPVEGPLLDFFADRLKVYLRGQGIRHDVVEAVLHPPGQKTGVCRDMDDFLRAHRCMKSLSDFINTREGENLLAGYKRAVNILRVEKKQGKMSHKAIVNPSQLHDKAECALFDAITRVAPRVKKALKKENFTVALTELAQLRDPIDTFFDTVTVNAKDSKVRRNRLALLSQIETALSGVADFSRIEGGERKQS